MGKPERITFPTIEGSYRGMYPSERALVLKVYHRALAALDIPHGEIRRDYLAGAHIEAVADFRNEGLAAADAEQRADDLIEQVMLVMANGDTWLWNRIALCEREA